MIVHHGCIDKICRLFDIAPESLISFNAVTMQSMMCVNDWIYKGPNVTFACCHISLFYFYHTGLFKNTDLIKCTFYRMCPILRSFLQWRLYDIWGCAISWVISLLMTLRMIVIYITTIKSEIGIIMPLNRVRSQNNGMGCMYCYSIFFDIKINIQHHLICTYTIISFI